MVEQAVERFRSLGVKVAFVALGLLGASLLLALVGTRAHATPPLSPLRALEQLAEKEDISVVRERYRAEVDRLVQTLAKPTDELSGRELADRYSSIAEVYDYAGSWAEVEARGIHRAGTVAPEIEGKVWAPILDAVTRAVAATDALETRLSALPSEVLTEFRQFERVTNPIGAMALPRDGTWLRLAILAKVAQRRDWLDETFRTSRGRVGDFARAEDFLARMPVARFLGLEVPASAPARAQPSESEKAEIRDVIEEFFRASVAKDHERVERLFTDAASSREYAAKLDESTTISCDLADARYLHEKDVDGVITVVVENISGVKTKNGGERRTVGRQTFRIVMRDGQAKILSVGDAK